MIQEQHAEWMTFLFVGNSFTSAFKSRPGLSVQVSPILLCPSSLHCIMNRSNDSALTGSRKPQLCWVTLSKSPTSASNGILLFASKTKKKISPTVLV